MYGVGACRDGRDAKQTNHRRLSYHGALYKDYQKEKGRSKAIIAIARKLSKIVLHILRNDAWFDPQRMTDPGLRKIAREMQVALPAA
jgi:lactam utilization protein B